jgi:hypothetical protein
MADVVLDAAANKIGTATRQTVCSGEPANFAGIAAVLLASVVTDAGDFTVANGDVSGRKVTVAQQASVPITNSGSATHVAYDDGSALLAVTTCTAQALTSGGTVTIPAHKFEFGDPT